jgi:hypothetical protein
VRSIAALVNVNSAKILFGDEALLNHLERFGYDIRKVGDVEVREVGAEHRPQPRYKTQTPHPYPIIVYISRPGPKKIQNVGIVTSNPVDLSTTPSKFEQEPCFSILHQKYSFFKLWGMR